MHEEDSSQSARPVCEYVVITFKYRVWFVPREPPKRSRSTRLPSEAAEAVVLALATASAVEAVVVEDAAVEATRWPRPPLRTI